MEVAAPLKLTRRGALAGLAGALAAGPALAQTESIIRNIRGPSVQGGFVIIETRGAGLPLRLNGELIGETPASGLAVIGFDRDTEREQALQVGQPGDMRLLLVAPRTYSIQRVNGLPQSTVTPRDPALLARIRREAERKTAAFASRADIDDFAQPWVRPVPGRVSSSYGNQRILNGEPGRPHYGVDIAAGRGTPVVAPAGGVVALADPDMHFEGGLVLLDHGQGLVSAYLHLSRIDVRDGQRVAQGERLGAVGSSGRATGPHLCWRLKWRDRNLDPSLWL